MISVLSWVKWSMWWVVLWLDLKMILKMLSWLFIANEDMPTFYTTDLHWQLQLNEFTKILKYARSQLIRKCNFLYCEINFSKSLFPCRINFKLYKSSLIWPHYRELTTSRDQILNANQFPLYDQSSLITIKLKRFNDEEQRLFSNTKNYFVGKTTDYAQAADNLCSRLNARIRWGFRIFKLYFFASSFQFLKIEIFERY